MIASEKAELDIGYVRDMVARAEGRPTPTSIYMLWAVIVLIGFALVDFFPQHVGLFWMIASPLGGIASGVLSWRYGKRRGHVNREVGRRHALHWSGMLVVILLAVLLAALGHIPAVELSRVILLIVTFGWWCAGVHFDRVFLWLGGLLALGFIGTLILPNYAWTALGAAVAAALTIIALRRGRSDDLKAQ